MSTTEDSFRERLDDYYDWPSPFLFKFIAPHDQVDRVLALFDSDAEITTRWSSGGKWISVTTEIEMESSEAVLDVYRRAGTIEGVVAL